MLAREVTALVHGARPGDARRAGVDACCSARTSRRSTRTMCWRCSRMCRRRSSRARRSTARASAMVDLVARVQLAPSKSEARRLVQSGGVYVNNRRDRRSAGADHARSGDWRAAVRGAEGPEAEPSRPADLTACGDVGTRYWLRTFGTRGQLSAGLFRRAFQTLGRSPHGSSKSVDSPRALLWG